MFRIYHNNSGIAEFNTYEESYYYLQNEYNFDYFEISPIPSVEKFFLNKEYESGPWHDRIMIKNLWWLGDVEYEYQEE